MIDTSALVAALLPQHVHHRLARPHLPSTRPIPAIVLAETYSQLRRTFALSPESASHALGYWSNHEGRIAVLPPGGHAEIYRQAVALGLGSNIHDALIAKTCSYHGLSLATLDRRQHSLALALGVESNYLLA